MSSQLEYVGCILSCIRHCRWRAIGVAQRSQGSQASCNTINHTIFILELQKCFSIFKFIMPKSSLLVAGSIRHQSHKRFNEISREDMFFKWRVIYRWLCAQPCQWTASTVDQILAKGDRLYLNSHKIDPSVTYRPCHWIICRMWHIGLFSLKILKTDSVQSSSNTCKNYLLKIFSQHGNFLNAI